MATLSQLLAQPALGLRLLQAGAGDPNITWVSTTELIDLSEFLDGGELVLTTGLSLKADDGRWLDFVAGLSRARIAGIGFGVGVAHERIPDALRAAAAAFRVALIEVPPPTPFIAISKAVSSLLTADELRSAHEALLAQQRILDHAFGETGPAGVVSAVAAATGRQVAVVSRAGTVLASTVGFPQSVDAEIVYPTGGEHGDEHSGGDHNSSDGINPATLQFTSLDIGAGRRLMVGGGPLGPEARAALTAGAIVLSVENRGQERAGEREAQRWSRLTQALLDGNPHAPGHLHLLDPAVSVPSLLRVIAVQGGPEAVSAWRAEPRGGIARLVTLPSEPTRGVARAWQIITDGAPTEHAATLAASHGLDAVVGTPSPLDACLASRRTVDPYLPTLSAVDQLYQEPRVPLTIYADRDSPVLGALADAGDAAAHALVASVLGPLRADGAEGGSGEGDGDPLAITASDHAALRTTVRALLTHHGNRGATAEHLGVHRNTLRTRIARAEALLERSLADPDVRAEVWIALRLEERLQQGLAPLGPVE